MSSGMIHTFVCASPQQGFKALLQLTTPDHDPFSQDWVVCPHPESARWVSQQVALERGVRAQLEVYPTGRWVSELQATLWPRSPQVPPLNRMTWAVVQGAARLAQRLSPDHEITRLFADRDLESHDESEISPNSRSSRRRGRALAGHRLRAAQRLAKQLRRLLLTRPHWLQSWDQETHDSYEWAVNETPWPELWREVSRVLGPIDRVTQTTKGDRIARWSDWLEVMCERAAQPAGPLTQKVRRIIFYGHHRYDAQTLALARACAQSLDIGLITIDPQACAPDQVEARRERAHASLLIGVPLLNRQGGGFTAHRASASINATSDSVTQGVGARSHSETMNHLMMPEPPFPVHLPPPQELCELTPCLNDPRTLLHRFQRDLSRDHSRPDAPERLGDDLTSFRFHSSYSDQRQIEDLYQTLLGLFRRDPTLKPRDVLVLCSDLERFSPLIMAVFSGGTSEDLNVRDQFSQSEAESAPPKRLGAEVARPHGHNPFAEILISLLTLSASRLYRYDVFELLKTPLVSAQFSLTLSEILKLEQWTRESGVRWGMDAAHRRSCGLNDEAQHTWEFGLDRLLIGTLMGNEDQNGLRAPYKGVAPMNVGDQSEEVLLSRFMKFFSTLRVSRERLTQSHTPRVWCEVLIEVLRQVCAVKSSEARALRQDVESDLYRALKRSAPARQRMTPKAIRVLLEGGIGRQRVILGAGRDRVRFYPLDQAYSVPSRVICLLNMSEGCFPTRHRPDPQDPTRSAPLPTDLDPLSEQQCNVISSLLAAQDQVHLFYTGQKSDGESRPPAPLVLAIQDEFKARYQVDDVVGDRLIDAMTTRHPLHSFSARNFVGDDQGHPTEETISHEPLWLEGAQEWRAAMTHPQHTPAFAGRGLDVATRGVSHPRVDTLRQLLKNPSEFFLKRGVGMRLVRDEEITRERELLELNHLQSWTLKDRVFKLLRTFDERRTLSENSTDSDVERADSDTGSFDTDWSALNDRVMNQVRAEGLLPMGRMGEVSFEQTMEEMRSLYERFTQARGGADVNPLAMNISLPSGRPLRLEGEMRFGDRLIFTTPSRYQERTKDDDHIPRGDRLIEPWLYHVALSASGAPYEGTTLVARDGEFTDFPPLTMRRATEILERWSDLLEDGSLRPLRFDPGLSWRWANAEAQGTSEAEAWTQLQEAATRWRRSDDEYVRQTFGDEVMWGERPAYQTSVNDHDEGSAQRDQSEAQRETLRGQVSERDESGSIDPQDTGMREERSSQESDQSVSLRVHPEFARCAQLVFGDLARALVTEERST